MLRAMQDVATGFPAHIPCDGFCYYMCLLRRRAYYITGGGAATAAPYPVSVSARAMVATYTVKLSRPEGDSKVALIFGHMNKSPGARAHLARKFPRRRRSTHCSLTTLEVLDLLGRVPCAVNYQPALSTDAGGV